MRAAGKLDLFKAYAADYIAPRRPTLVATRPGRYLTIAGAGDPDGVEFAQKVGALYAVAYTIRMGRKRLGQDYKIAPLEGLWWAAGRSAATKPARRSAWRWKLLIRVPDFVRARCVTLAARMLLAKGSARVVTAVRLERIAEGPCIQMLHVGPYAAEEATVEAMRRFAKANALRLSGRHHEIYLSDPRRVKPAKLRTILRLPVAPRGARAR
jgi:hypothetical protein